MKCNDDTIDYFVLFLFVYTMRFLSLRPTQKSVKKTWNHTLNEKRTAAFLQSLQPKT